MNWKQSLFVVGWGLAYGYVFAVGTVWLKVGIAVVCLIQAWQGIQRIRSLYRAIAIGQRAWASEMSALLEEVELSSEIREQFETALEQFRSGNMLEGCRLLEEANKTTRTDCLYYSGQPSLKCAVNPASPCEACSHFEAKSI